MSKLEVMAGYVGKMPCKPFQVPSNLKMITTFSSQFARGSWKEDRLLAATMFLNLLLEHDNDLDDDEDSGHWQLLDSREMPDKLFTFPSRRFSKGADNIRFATTPLHFISPGAPSFFEGSAIYVLKRFATPDLLVLSSCIICPQARTAISTS